MEADLDQGGMKLFDYEEDEEKCDLPTDSDIEQMRAEEEEESELTNRDNVMEKGEAQKQEGEDHFQKLKKKKQVGDVKRQNSRVKDKNVPVPLKVEMRKSKVNLNPGRLQGDGADACSVGRCS